MKLEKGKIDNYNFWKDKISSKVFDKFRRFQGDKPIKGLLESEITMTYKDILELCQSGAESFLNDLIQE